MTTYDLLILFKNGSRKVIVSVSDYGICDDKGVFHYVKNGYRSFVPIDSVIFFGRAFDFEEEKNHVLRKDQ